MDRVFGVDVSKDCLDAASLPSAQKRQFANAPAGVAEQACKAGRDIAAALEESFAADYSGLDASERSKLETLNGVHSNAAGFRRWLERRPAAGDQEVSV